MARDEEPGAPYLQALQRAFQFAREHGREPDPADFLVGLAAGSGAAAAALHPGSGLSLADIAAVSGGPARPRAGYLHMQAQEAATSLAAARAQPVAPGPLLIALLDQGTPEVAGLLSRAGLDPAAVRRAALAAIGAPADLPPIPLPAPTPAGTLDRPPLPVADLDPRAWAVLRWRQAHLPLRRLRGPADLRALINLERSAAWRVASRLGLDDDQRHSLVWQHAGQVSQLTARARSDLIGAGPHPAGPHPAGPRAGPHPGPPRPPRNPRRPGIPVGWATWLGNRQEGLRDRWFRLRTSRSYRGCPQP